MVASFFLLHKANQQVEKLPIETHVICQLPSQCRKKKKWYPSGQDMAVSSKWLHLFCLFNNKANQDKMTNRDPCNLPAAFSMLKNKNKKWYPSEMAVPWKWLHLSSFAQSKPGA